MRLPLIYSFLINISKSFTVERHACARQLDSLKGGKLFAPAEEQRKDKFERKVLMRDKYFAINTRGGGNKEEGCWGVARSQ